MSNHFKYSIEMDGPNRILYQEGDRSISIYCEPLVGPGPSLWSFIFGKGHGLGVHLDRVGSWSTPSGEAPLTVEDRERVRGRLVRRFGRVVWETW
jgi:hypothetical protein